MAAYLITYDLSDPDRESDLLNYIKINSWAQASKSSYAVISSKTAEQIVADIQKITNNEIVVYVFTVRRPYSGFGPKEVNDWLAPNMS